MRFTNPHLRLTSFTKNRSNTKRSRQNYFIMTHEKYYNESQLIDPSTLDLEDVPGRRYRTFDPVPHQVVDVCMVEYGHNADDVIDGKYLFYPAISSRHTPEGELVFIRCGEPNQRRLPRN